MRCTKNEYVTGAVFHFYNKTPDKKLLFRCDEDYVYFLNKLKYNIKKYPCEVYAYCLMPNHFHFCLKQKSDMPLYRIFNDTLTSYALYYNHKYQIKGKLLQDRLQSKRVNKDCYLLLLCNYIHNNPVRAGLVEDVAGWEYSNFLEYARLRNGSLYSKELISYFPDDFVDYLNSIKNYQQYINDVKFKELLF